MPYPQRPGNRQQALLRALEGAEAVWVVPEGASHAEAVCWRRAARVLVQWGRARAIYRRRRDASGRWVRHLVLIRPDSDLQGDAYPLRSPRWVEPPPPFGPTFSAQIQAAVLEHQTGLSVSPRTAARLAQRWNDDRAGAVDIAGVRGAA